MYRAVLAAGAALAIGSALFGTIALMHISTQYHLDVEVDAMLRKIDTSFTQEMQRRCGGPESTWKPLSSGRGYQCYDKRGRPHRPLPPKEQSK